MHYCQAQTDQSKHWKTQCDAHHRLDKDKPSWNDNQYNKWISNGLLNQQID